MMEEVEAVLSSEIRPALGVHGGSIRVDSVTDERITLELVASCRACYFRKGCVANLVLPTLHEHVGDDVSIDVRGVPVRPANQAGRRQ